MARNVRHGVASFPRHVSTSVAPPGAGYKRFDPAKHRLPSVRRWGVTVRRPFILLLAGLAAIGIIVPAVSASQPTRCTDSSRGCVVTAAESYIRALVSHQGSSVPLAPGARRTENGMVTGTSGPGIAHDLSTNQGDRSIYDARDVRWFVNRDEAIAYYLLDTAVGAGTSAPHTTTEHLAERFRVDRGLIEEIEAVFWISPGPSPDSDCWSAPC
jgi:hypothetical protein